MNNNYYVCCINFSISWYPKEGHWKFRGEVTSNRLVTEGVAAILFVSSWHELSPPIRTDSPCSIFFLTCKVDVSTSSLDPTFSFVLDAGLKIYIWSGERVRLWIRIFHHTTLCLQ